MGTYLHRCRVSKNSDAENVVVRLRPCVRATVPIRASLAEEGKSAAVMKGTMFYSLVYNIKFYSEKDEVTIKLS